MASSSGLDKTTFVQDETLKRAYVRSIEVIGEAVKQLPNTLRQKYTTIEWRAIAGMRDQLIHLSALLETRDLSRGGKEGRDLCCI